MDKEELEKEAREYLAEHSEYSEMFGQTFVAVDTLTAMVGFALPREKRIADLEQKLEQTEKDLADYQFNYPTIKELQKENAELKERLKEHESIGNAQFWENVWSWKTKAEQLTKAKEIIKKLIEAIHIWDCKNLEEVEAEAEQFISEVEK